MRRAWLPGRESVHKRYLTHVAGFNLGVLMRALNGQGTPREAEEAVCAVMSFSKPTPAVTSAAALAGSGDMSRRRYSQYSCRRSVYHFQCHHGFANVRLYEQ
jgi:hypothetical protein